MLHFVVERDREVVGNWLITKTSFRPLDVTCPAATTCEVPFPWALEQPIYVAVTCLVPHIETNRSTPIGSKGSMVPTRTGQATPGTNTFGPPLGHDDPTGVRSHANKIAETDLVVGPRGPAFSRQGPQGPGPIGGVLRVDRVREKVKIDST